MLITDETFNRHGSKDSFITFYAEGFSQDAREESGIVVGGVGMSPG